MCRSPRMANLRPVFSSGHRGTSTVMRLVVRDEGSIQNAQAAVANKATTSNKRTARILDLRIHGRGRMDDLASLPLATPVAEKYCSSRKVIVESLQMSAKPL